MTSQPTADQLRHDWNSNPRWAGVTRPYAAEEVVRLRGTVAVEHSLARLGADKLWNSLQSEPVVTARGALTGHQAMQQGLAGLTTVPAQALGVGDEVGRIAPGQRADLVLWSGDPLEVNAVALQVWMDGRAIPMRSRQTELRDRYLRTRVPADNGGLPRAYPSGDAAR